MKKPARIYRGGAAKRLDGGKKERIVSNEGKRTSSGKKHRKIKRPV